MPQSSLVSECESFRKNVMFSIETMDITEEQKQVFLLSHQSFYLQLLQQLFVSNNMLENTSALAEIVN